MPLDFDRMASAGRTMVQRAPLLPRSVLAALGLGAAFGVGIVVGNSGDAHADVSPSQPKDTLAIAAERGSALEETRARLRLTYANELVKPDAAEPPRAPPEKIAVAKGTAPTSAATSAPARNEEAADPLEAPPAPLVEAAIAPVVPARALARATEIAEPEPGVERAEDVEKRNAADLKAALARVVNDVKPTARFTLQVAAAPTQAGADDFVKKLAAQGHDARVIEGQVGGKAVFRVRVGAFSDRAQADSYKGKLAMPAFIVSE